MRSHESPSRRGVLWAFFLPAGWFASASPKTSSIHAAAASKQKKKKRNILHATFKWRRINKKVGGNFENKFPTPFFMQEKSRRKVLRGTVVRKKGGALECYVQ
jgi:hypothetical protein